MLFKDLEIGKKFCFDENYVEEMPGLGKEHMFRYHIFRKAHDTCARIVDNKKGSPQGAWNYLDEFRFISPEMKVVPL